MESTTTNDEKLKEILDRLGNIEEAENDLERYSINYQIEIPGTLVEFRWKSIKMLIWCRLTEIPRSSSVYFALIQSVRNYQNVYRHRVKNINFVKVSQSSLTCFDLTCEKDRAAIISNERIAVRQELAKKKSS